MNTEADIHFALTAMRTKELGFSETAKAMEQVRRALSESHLQPRMDDTTHSLERIAEPA